MDEPDGIARWLAGAEARHLASLRTSDVSRALRALSSAYVERRGQAIPGGRVLDGAGKRAAFALYYAPLHYLLIRHIARSLEIERPREGVIVDLGCGTGAAGAAVAPARVLGVDSHPWAVDEARHTYRAFGIDAVVTRGDIARVRFPRDTSLVVAAFVINELTGEARPRLLKRLLDQPHALVVEPISRRVSPWWPEWVTAFERAGGRADEWKVEIAPPSIVRKLGDAAGLTAAATGRSLYR
jgi:SAM-dependent methyltransferase